MRLFMTTCALLLLTGCPEDPRSADGTTPEAGGPAPTPGDPGAGGLAGGAPPPEGERPGNARFEVAEGQGVTLTGTVSYPGSKTGQMRMDFLTLGENSHPQLVHATSLAGVGEFSIEVPKDFGALHIVAFIDVAGDGPSPTDPAAATKVQVGAEDVSGLALALSDEPDLGELTPGGPPEGGVNSAPETPPPAEGAPPEGAPPEGAPPEGAPAEAPPPEEG